MTDPKKREKFDSWLRFMPEALATWRRNLPGDLAAELDGTLESLDRLEAWLLARYPTQAAADLDSETDMIDGCARYVGETYRGLYGGRWDIYLDDEKNFIYGIPHMTGFQRGGPPIVPLDLVHNALHKRTGAFFRFVSGSLEPFDDDDDLD